MVIDTVECRLTIPCRLIAACDWAHTGRVLKTTIVNETIGRNIHGDSDFQNGIIRFGRTSCLQAEEISRQYKLTPDPRWVLISTYLLAAGGYGL